METAGALVKQASATITHKTSSPATPQSANTGSPQPEIATPSPGRWRHPQFDEITRRQKASSFDDSNVQRIIWNAAAIIAIWLLRSFFQSAGLVSIILPQPEQSYLHNILLVFALLPASNIGLALWPLYKGHDNVPDIPLTPTQRALLGLDPNATPPPTPGTQYITPPRYPRSPTPRSGSPASNRSSRSSAGSTRKNRSSDSPSYGKLGIDSPFSPSPSPLWQKATLGSGRDAERRRSIGSPSPLGLGTSARGERGVEQSLVVSEAEDME
ncbi:MAG: hypothetical protein L6R39_007526 [Caloplaca ligustica]|nr:MAG: hypothetical protein L6R39_007526 [Caloplaca ligustica]